MLIGILSNQVNGTFACAYPLDASSAEVIGLGFSGKLTMTDAEQTGTLTTNGTNRALAAMMDSAALTFDVTTGRRVIEWRISAPALVEAAGQVTVEVGVITTPTLGPVVGARVQRIAGDPAGQCRLTVFDGTGTDVYDNTAFTIVAGVVVLGVELDATGSTFRVIADGSELLLTGNSYAGSNRDTCITYAVIAENGVNGADVGKDYAATVRTSASDITQTYGAGATDLCGNSL